MFHKTLQQLVTPPTLAGFDMTQILNINGKPYTSASEEIQLEKVKANAFKTLEALITNALRTTKYGNLQIDPTPLSDAIEQAYYLGKENALK